MAAHQRIRRHRRSWTLPKLLLLLLAKCSHAADVSGEDRAACAAGGVEAFGEHAKPAESRDDVVVGVGGGGVSTHDSAAADGPRRTARRWRWIPEAEHRCNITRMTSSEVEMRFGFGFGFGFGGLPPLYPHPLVVRRGKDEPRRNAKFADMTSLENIVDNLPPNFNVTLSSSNSFSAHRRTMPLTQYLDETVNGETYPDQLSNETWYLFGETYGPGWKELLLNFELPPCRTCSRDLSALAFGVGNRGSGVQWHTHGPGFSECVHGRKHWVLYPPDRRPSYDSDYASRHWMEGTYGGIDDDDDLPHECTLEPGDMVYFPDRWHHATINLDPYTVFVSTFTTEHL